MYGFVCAASSRNIIRMGDEGWEAYGLAGLSRKKVHDDDPQVQLLYSSKDHHVSNC